MNELETLQKGVKVLQGRMYYEAKWYEEQKLQNLNEKEKSIVDKALSTEDTKTSTNSLLNDVGTQCIERSAMVEAQCNTDNLRKSKFSVSQETKISIGTSTDDLEEWIKKQFLKDKESSVSEWNISENMLFRDDEDEKSHRVSPMTAVHSANLSYKKKPRLLLDDEVSSV